MLRKTLIEINELTREQDYIKQRIDKFVSSLKFNEIGITIG